MREAALKSVIFVGVSRVSYAEQGFHSLSVEKKNRLADPVPDGLKDVYTVLRRTQAGEKRSSASRRNAENIEATIQRGMKFKWKFIYSRCTTNCGRFIPISSVLIHSHLTPVVLSSLLV